MRNAISWAKSNLITLVAAALALGSLVALGVIHSKGNKFMDEMKKQGELISQLQRYKRSPVDILSVRPDDPMETRNICINKAAIEQRASVYQAMDEQWEGIFEEAVQINRFGVGRKGHQPMLEGLFPEPASNSAPFTARTRYRQVFDEMLGPNDPDASYPRLNAGMPPGQATISMALQAVEDQFYQSLAFAVPQGGARQQLTWEQQRDLEQKKSARLKNLLWDQASNVHLYAAAPLQGASPFDIGPWSQAATSPPMDYIWVGQMGLWIQQDIVEAIARVNDVDNPNANVMTAPVKRLMHIIVADGSVGIESRGVLVEGVRRGQRDRGEGDRSASRSQIPQGFGQMGGFGGPMGGGGFGMAPGGFGGPMGGGGFGMAPGGFGGPMGPGGFGGGPPTFSRPQATQGRGRTKSTRSSSKKKRGGRRGRSKAKKSPLRTMTLDAEGRQPDDFAVSHTGRCSNGIYDVYHASVSVIVDSGRLAQFLDELSKVNFMTVLRLDVRDVDEYEALASSGFVYGSDDAVQADILLETIWLRDWTTQYMPEAVKKRLFIPTEEEEENV